MRIHSLAALILAVPAFAGPIDPPAGPVAPTPGPEPRIAVNTANTPGDADSQFKITQPGSYYLAGNITGVSGRIGIEIAASNVTLDLNGFAMIGVPGSLVAIDGSANGVGGFFGITIRNGSITNWSSVGVFLGSLVNVPTRHLVENLEVNAVTGGPLGGIGIGVGAGSAVRNCRIANCNVGVQGSQAILVESTISSTNASHGFNLNENSILRNCVALGNGNDGIVVNEGTLVESCTTNINGLVGIRILNRSGVVVNCRADQNFAGGIVVGPGSVVRGSTANDNVGVGINAGDTSTISDCSASANTQAGITVNSGTVRGCTARENGTDGISVNTGSLVENCSASANVDDGFQIGNGCRAIGNTASGNGDDGIIAGSDCTIRDNNCDGNGTTSTDGAGIHVVGTIFTSASDTRVEGNNCTDSDFGIWIENAGNLIIANSCSGNTTNFNIATSNRYGPIINIIAGGSASVNGSTATSTLASTDPHANFAY